MSKESLIQQEKACIQIFLEQLDSPVSLGKIEKYLSISINKKTLQRRMKDLIDEGQVSTEGEKRNTKYYLHKDIFNQDIGTNNKNKDPIFSSAAMSQLSYLDSPSYARKQSSYKFALVDDYIPNHQTYCPATQPELQAHWKL